MWKAIILVSACILVNGCDRPERSATPPASPTNQTYESVRGAAEGPYEQVELDEVSDPSIIAAAAEQISVAGYPCGSISQLWKVDFKKDVGMTILKVRCSGSTDYQLTLFDNKGFVKPWTGTLLGE